MKVIAFYSFIFLSLFMPTGQAIERLICQDQSETSDSSLNLVPDQTYGVLGELKFEELEAHLICSQVTPSSMECLGHWKREEKVLDKIELYVIESDQDQKAQAFFGLPSDYGKKQVWFKCSSH